MAEVFALMKLTGIGAKAASTQTGVPVPTIKSWLKRHGDPRANKGHNPAGVPGGGASPGRVAPPQRARSAGNKAGKGGASPAPTPRLTPASELEADDSTRLLGIVRTLHRGLARWAERFEAEASEFAAWRPTEDDDPDAERAGPVSIDIKSAAAAEKAARVAKTIVETHPGLMKVRGETGKDNAPSDVLALLDAAIEDSGE